MNKIVLDTNCLVVSVSPSSKYHIVWDNLEKGEYDLFVTDEIIYEYQEILEHFISPEVASEVVWLLLNLKNVHLVETYYKFNLIKQDPDDNKFVDCAIAVGATYIVSNDNHFNELNKYDFPKVEHINIYKFMDWLKENHK